MYQTKFTVASTDEITVLSSELLPEDAFSEGVNGGRSVRFFSEDVAACEAMNSQIEQKRLSLRNQLTADGWDEEEMAGILPYPEIFITPQRSVAMTGWEKV